jgi:thioredoxin 1
MSGKFMELIEKSNTPVLADFWAEWCGPCRMMAPVLQELAREWKGKITVVKVNSDEQPALASRFNISAIPTLILFHHGREIHRVSGAMPLAALKDQLKPWIK